MEHAPSLLGFQKVMATTLLSEGDGFVIAMLATMALSFSVVGLLFLSMRWNAARRDREVDALLDEVAEEERKELLAVRDESPSPSPWERDGDWWKS